MVAPSGFVPSYLRRYDCDQEVAYLRIVFGRRLIWEVTINVIYLGMARDVCSNAEMVAVTLTLVRYIAFDQD